MFFAGGIGASFLALVLAVAASGAGGPPVAARVIIVEDPQATVEYIAQPVIVRRMVEDGLVRLTGADTAADAWRQLVSTSDRVGIKVFSGPGRFSGTRPAVVEAVARGLMEAGLPATNLLIWDRSLVDLRLAGFTDLATQLGVRLAASADAGYDEDHFYDTPLLGRLVFGDHEFGRKGDAVARKSFVSKLVTREMTKIISIAPMLNHNALGVAGNLLNVSLGSVDNLLRFEGDRDRLFTAIPEIHALPILGDRVALNITDALVCQYEGGERGLLHYSVALNELRFSTDPVALDVLSVRELERHRQPPRPGGATNFTDLFRNASLVEIGVSEPTSIRVERVSRE
jgi:Domain of unknown function (DUF362)